MSYIKKQEVKMDKRAQLTGMHFGIEIETVNLKRKDTLEAIHSIIWGTVVDEL